MLAGVWATQAGGANADSGRSIAALSDGSAIVAGDFTATATFGSTTLSQTGTSLTNGSGFVAKLNSDGTYAWATKVGRNATAVAALPDGSSIVTGAFVGSAVFGSTVLAARGGVSDTDIFVAKVTPAGQFAWATGLGSSSSLDISRGISAFPDGSTVVTGTNANDGFVAGVAADGRLGFTTKVSGTPIAVAALPDGSAFFNLAGGFVTKFGQTGIPIWTAGIGGTGYSISAGTDGSAYVAGAFEGSRQFGNLTLVSSGKADGFVAKIRGDGQYCWATRFGGADEVDTGRGVSALVDGSAVVVGSSDFSTPLPSSNTTFLVPASRVTFSKVSPDGVLTLDRRFGQNFSGNSANGVASFPDGSAVLTGSFVSGISFQSTSLGSRGNSDVFVARAAPSGTFAVAPSVPVSVTGSATANGQVSLSWQLPSNGGASISRYAIQFSDDGGATWKLFRDDLPGFLPSARVDGLTNSRPYVFRVSAVNEAGSSPFSQPSAAITPQPFAPDAPTGVVGLPGDKQVTLSWQRPLNDGGSAITSYSVSYSADRGATWQLAGVAPTTTSAVITGLSNGTAYVFRVAASNAIGTGTGSNYSASITPRTVPSMVGGVVGTPGVNRVSLSWAAPFTNGGATIIGYTVQYSSDNGKTWATSAVQPPETKTVVGGLVNNVSYVFRVAAVNAAGQGAFSYSSSAVIPQATVPGAPPRLLASAGSWVANLSWAAPADDGGARITGYLIQFSSDLGKTWRTATTVTQATATSTSAVVRGIVIGTSYIFRVAALNSAGMGAFSTVSAPVVPFR